MPNAAFQCSIPLTAPYAFNTTTPLRRPRTIHRTSFRAKPLHISTSLRACTEIPTPPTTLDVLIPQVAATVDTAIANGHRRLQLTTLIPGLNPQIENTVPYNEELFQQIALQLILSSEKLSQYPTISLLFKSAGTAAAALNQFRKSEIAIPENVNIASYFGRDAAMGKSRIGNANIIVNPASARGNPVFKDLMSLLAEDKDAIWILINPDFSADRAALGMREIEETEMFLASFTSVFYFRNLFEVQRPRLIAVERGALLFVYPGKYHLFNLTETGYAYIDSTDDMPSPNEITTKVQRARAMNAKPRVLQDGTDEEFLKVVAASALLVATVYIALKVGLVFQ